LVKIAHKQPKNKIMIAIYYTFSEEKASIYIDFSKKRDYNYSMDKRIMN
jgi:hypothetical protein